MRQVIESNLTPAPELLLIAYRALSPSEQEQAYELIHNARLQRLAGDDSEAGRMISSLKRVADLLGEAPGIEDYKRIRTELANDGEQLEPVSRIVKHFNGSWHLAREAVSLVEINTPRRIEARFAHRRLGKVWRYTDESLRECVQRCASEIGHVPQIAEFDHWRHRELELATARGEDLHLPSAGPYRRRWGTWAAALSAFGYSDDEIQGRLERK
jgi:hypothetical protein